MSNVEKILKKHKVLYKIHEYTHDEENISYAQEAADKLWVELWVIFKTLVIEWWWDLFVAIISVKDQLDLKKFATELWKKKVKMWEKSLVEKTTWYIFWWISPIWQKKKLKTFLDISSQEYEAIYISAGNKWVEVEITPDDLLKLIQWKLVDISK